MKDFAAAHPFAFALICVFLLGMCALGYVIFEAWRMSREVWREDK